MRLLERYFGTISEDTGKYCFSVEDTLQALEMGAVEDLILWENLEVNRSVLRNEETGEETVLFLPKETGVTETIVKKELLLDWICDNYKSFGCNLELVSDRSAQGAQFVCGFGGIGGTLRWAVHFKEPNGCEEETSADNEESSETGDHSADYKCDFEDGSYGL